MAFYLNPIYPMALLWCYNQLRQSSERALGMNILPELSHFLVVKESR